MRRLVLGLMACGATALVLVALLVGPYVRDDLSLDRVVKVVALDWRDFGEAKARQRLLYELDHQTIGLHVPDEACRLVSEEQALVVRCSWEAVIRVPLTPWSFTLPFQSTAMVPPS